MEGPSIDGLKLPAAMEIIEKAAALMEERDCDNDNEAIQELVGLQQSLRELTGNKDIQIEDFRRYWGYTDLETMARKALLPPPAKSDVTDGQIKEIVLSILGLGEAEMDWWLQYLALNTGLENLTDYIFYPDLAGLSPQATLEEIAEKIIADRK